jgi:DNA mismatch repair protein MutS
VTTKTAPEKETPLMKQYFQIKRKYPDALLLFRVGDFYETFGEDAIKTSRILGIVLTQRKNGAAAAIELAGFPHHALETYLPKLVRAGQRVAICDQLEDPKTTKTIVKRGVTELVTPGLALSENVLDTGRNNFLASVCMEQRHAGLALLDISTGEFYTAEGSLEYIDKLLQSLQPSELIHHRDQRQEITAAFGAKWTLYPLDAWIYDEDFARDILLRHFEVKSLKGFGIDDLHLAVTAAGTVMHYLAETQHHRTGHIHKLSRIDEQKHVWLDKFTIRNLELLQPLQPGGKSLVDILDHTATPMGARLIKRWIVMPLNEPHAISRRHDAVEHFTQSADKREHLRLLLKSIGDLERLITRISLNRVGPREVAQLARALQSIAPIITLCSETGVDALKDLGHRLQPCSSLISDITTTLNEDPPAQIQKGNAIQSGIDAHLDEYRSLMRNGKEYLVKMQEKEAAVTGITSLKVGFNNVFGYYLEVTHAHKHKVPSDWVRKQTLTGAERYITEELKEYETKILSAEEKILLLETSLFEDLVRRINEQMLPVQQNAQLLAELDCLLSLAIVAAANNYRRPTVASGDVIHIEGGRHPVIEHQLAEGEQYIPNDVYIDRERQQIHIITGPNMAGKSAYLRQVALIALMAQCGSLVPAKSASIGLVDKIFTRVGASDNISQGESTFMVEMSETASILNNISERSLVILDEIGRGTSTYDGISIAWAITEFLHQHPRRPRTLFATHYHELNEMCTHFPRISNFSIAIQEVGNKVIFLRKMIAGGSAHSFGIHVARMAGMPERVVVRAGELLKDLEEMHKNTPVEKNGKKLQTKDVQLSFFQLDDPVLSQIRDEILHIDINALTPVDALMKLNEIKNILGK